jgi:4-hydroxy-tetrahydrodipicolinate reductase
MTAAVGPAPHGAGIAIAGAAGRMGQALIRAILDAPSSPDPYLAVRLTGASERADSPAIGKDIAAQAGRDPIAIPISPTVAAAAQSADVWIDFTTPAATRAALNALPGGVKAVVIGTTGFSAEDEAAIAAYAQARAIVKAGNFSLGVAMLCALVRDAAAHLHADGWDIEITEAHHRRKIDAPSGTALMLAQAAAAGRGVYLDDVKLPHTDPRAGLRPRQAIGLSVVRGGGVIGEHRVLFAAEREVLSLSHSALDRSVFADGALTAARWAAHQPPGLYSIDDVLGL